MRDALASGASLSLTVVFEVATALGEHQDDTDDAPELEAEAIVVDEGFHLCSESADG